MKKDKNEYFVYKRKFNHSFRSGLENKIRLFKANIHLSLSKNKFTSKFLDSWEVYSLKKKNWVDKESFREIFKMSIGKKTLYKDINLNKVHYFEAIEIDNFDKYRKKIISKFGKNQLFFSMKGQNDLKKKLEEVKNNLDTISWGKLFSFSYKGKKTKKNDLISFVSANYIKTNESFFILKIEIKTSEKFNKIFKKIISAEDVGLTVPKYNTFYDILRTKRFISHESIVSSLRINNLEGLLSDLDKQVKHNITRHLKGYFHSSKLLPSIEHFEVGNMEEFEKDFDLKHNFNSGLDGHYSLADNEIKIFLSNSNRKEQTLIQVLKQKGHGTKESSKKDLTDYDDIETHYLLQSLAFPCVFKGILKTQFERLNKLKRDIYDFVEDSNSSNFFKKFLFIYYNNRYMKLKQKLTKILIINKRFESEFTKRNINLYTREFELNKFESRDRQFDDEKKNLRMRIVDDFSSEIKILDTKTRSTNEIFKSVEELNSYRTNFLLQVISLFIGILAFIFTFEKVKTIVIELSNKLFN